MLISRYRISKLSQVSFSIRNLISVMSDASDESFEQAVGITAFANTAVGFSGILKQRFSDFVVREVTLDGKVSSLIDTCGVDLEKKWFGDISAEDANNDYQTPSIAADRLINEIQTLLVNETQLTEAQITEVRAFIISCLEKDEEGPQFYVGILATDKATRTAIHGIFKKEISQFIDSDTMQVDNKSVIRLVAKHKNKGNKVDMKFKRAPTWPANLPNYLQFTLFKENIDTMTAIGIINKSLRLKPGAIAYNGTKDKRAVTAQKCTVYRRKPSEFAKINAYLHSPTIRVGDFEYVKTEAGLGALTGKSNRFHCVCLSALPDVLLIRLIGNRFEIVLRSLNKTKADIATACESLSHSGFINYYGLQRFGKGGSRSHDVGRAIFRNDFKACVDMLFTPNTFDREHVKTAKAHYAAGNLQKALDCLPEQMFGEKCVLQKLVKNPTDYPR